MARKSDSEVGTISPQDELAVEHAAMKRRQSDEGEQSESFAPRPGQVPLGFIRPPSLEQFSNAAWLPVGPEIDNLILGILGREELSDLSDVPYAAVWRRQGKPGGEERRRLAAPQIIPPIVQWLVVTDHEIHNFPRYIINLYWLHLDEMREDGDYVHPQTLERHLMDALLRLRVSEESGVLSTGGDPIEIAAALAKYYGLYDDRVVSLHRQLALWADRGDAQ